MDANHLELRALEKRYGSLPPSVAALSLSLARGELLGILGPSGCGKTTTLRMIAGLVPATSGRIVVDGRDVTRVPTHRRNMGVMFQSYALFPHMTIERNVAFGLEMRKLAPDVVAARVRRALEMVRLGPLAGRRPRELSGGQQQRVALARALVIEPAILLLDEPLSNLDAKLRDAMRSEIREIQRNLGITAVFVTHDQVEAMAICDRIAVMNAGRLEQIGTPIEVYEHPATPFVADFVGRTNRMAGRRTAPDVVEVEGTPLRVGRQGPVGEDVVLMVRPHRIRLTRTAAAEAGANALAGTVRSVTFVGDAFLYEVEAGRTVASVEDRTVAGQAPFRSGEGVHLAWRSEDTLVFAGETRA